MSKSKRENVKCEQQPRPNIESMTVIDSDGDGQDETKCCTSKRSSSLSALRAGASNVVSAVGMDNNSKQNTCRMGNVHKFYSLLLY